MSTAKDYAYYASLTEQRLVFAPEIIVESQGLSCGDKVSIALYTYREKVYFNIKSEGCSICHSVSQFLLHQYYASEQKTLIDKLNAYKNGLFENEAAWINTITANRSSCVQTVLQALDEALILKKFEHCDVDLDEKNVLACDACVNVFEPYWNRPEHQSDSLKEITLPRRLLTLLSIIIRSGSKQETTLQRLGKVSLDKNDQDLLQSLINQGAHTKLIKKLRLSVPYYNNAVRHKISLKVGDVTVLARKQIVNQFIVSKVIEKVDQYIQKNNLLICRVKGANTSTFYPAEEHRTHLDYDYIGKNISDTFHLIDFLLNKNGFSFVTGGSVPFSLKVVADQDGNELLTGHLHLEKILQDQYQLIVDINIGGFPLGRTKLITLNQIKKISTEEQLLITISHIFKHDVAYIKDINDAFYLLQSSTLSTDILIDLIKKHGMTFEFYVLVAYMQKNYPNIDFPISQLYSKLAHISTLLLARHWPYSRRSHGLLKLVSSARQCISTHGLKYGLKEFRKQVLEDHTDGLPSEQYSLINRYKYSRTYLYPMVIFNRFISLEKLNSLASLSAIKNNLIYRDKNHHMLITNNGIFLINLEILHDRNSIRVAIEAILNALDLSVVDLKQDYFLQARRDLWLY